MTVCIALKLYENKSLSIARQKTAFSIRLRKGVVFIVMMLIIHTHTLARTGIQQTFTRFAKCKMLNMTFKIIQQQKKNKKAQKTGDKKQKRGF